MLRLLQVPPSPEPFPPQVSAPKQGQVSVAGLGVARAETQRAFGSLRIQRQSGRELPFVSDLVPGALGLFFLLILTFLATA